MENKRILIIDDECSLTQLCKMFLETMGETGNAGEVGQELLELEILPLVDERDVAGELELYESEDLGQRTRFSPICYSPLLVPPESPAPCLPL